MYEDDVSGDDLSELMGEDDDMGASARRRRALVVRRSPLLTRVPGVQPMSQKRLPLGFGAKVFKVGDATSAQLVAETQIPFRGERLVIDIQRRGVGAQGIAVILNDLKVGNKSQFPAPSPISAETFRPDAYDVRMSLDSAQPGVKIVIDVALSSPVGGGSADDALVVTATLIGEAID
jgi:hypothetical protein